jgi:hypothetical protein
MVFGVTDESAQCLLHSLLKGLFGLFASDGSILIEHPVLPHSMVAYCC